MALAKIQDFLRRLKLDPEPPQGMGNVLESQNFSASFCYPIFNLADTLTQSRPKLSLNFQGKPIKVHLVDTRQKLLEDLTESYFVRLLQDILYGFVLILYISHIDDMISILFLLRPICSESLDCNKKHLSRAHLGFIFKAKTWFTLPIIYGPYPKYVQNSVILNSKTFRLQVAPLLFLEPFQWRPNNVKRLQR